MAGNDIGNHEQLRMHSQSGPWGFDPRGIDRALPSNSVAWEPPCGAPYGAVAWEGRSLLVLHHRKSPTCQGSRFASFCKRGVRVGRPSEQKCSVWSTDEATKGPVQASDVQLQHETGWGAVLRYCP